MGWDQNMVDGARDRIQLSLRRVIDTGWSAKVGCKIMDVRIKELFPPAYLAMLIQTYVAARVLRYGGSCSMQVQASNSIMAGCGEAGNMARISLYRLLDCMRIAHPMAPAPYCP